MELFADISHKARQRQRCAATVSVSSVADEEDKKRNCHNPRLARNKARQRCAATVSVSSVTDEEDKKRNCRKPRRARNVCVPVQQQQRNKVPSFSEFDDYSLFVESKNGDGGVNVDVDGHTDGDNSSLNVSGRANGGAGSLNNNVSGHVVGSDSSFNIHTGRHKQQEPQDCGETLDYNIEMLSHATDELCELRCLQHNTRHSAGYASLSASTQQCDIMSRTPGGLATSTPHPQSAMGLSRKMYSDLVHGTSQLLLSDVSADGEIGTYRCLVTAHHESQIISQKWPWLLIEGDVSQEIDSYKFLTTERTLCKYDNGLTL